jgi:hypothetical protein
MEAAMYLVGEPIFDLDPREDFLAPLGQAELCLVVLQETQDAGRVARIMAEEYLAIIYALRQMDVDFRIVFAHEEKIHKGVASCCARELGCRFARFGEGFFPPSIVYPRDFCTIIPGTLLVNEYVQILKESNKGWKIVSHPYGEGGRSLVAGDIILLSEWVYPPNSNTTRRVSLGEIEGIRQAGMRTAFFPPPAGIRIKPSGLTSRVWFSDHIDRVGTLLQGQSASLHLVMDPRCVLARIVDDRTRKWEPMFPDEAFSWLRRLIVPLGVELHIPPLLKVPYSVNLLQVPDGRVLMTKGEEGGLLEVIQSIVGIQNVFETELPIRYIPTWLYAGIRCLIGDWPEPLMKGYGG